MTLTWKINDTESSSVYTYKIQVTGETDSFTLNVNETQVIMTSLNSSTLYNITVHPFFSNSSEGVPGFLQVYTREFTHCFANLSHLPAMCQAQVCVPTLKANTAQCVSPQGLSPPSDVSCNNGDC